MLDGLQVARVFDRRSLLYPGLEAEFSHAGARFSRFFRETFSSYLHCRRFW